MFLNDELHKSLYHINLKVEFSVATKIVKMRLRKGCCKFSLTTIEEALILTHCSNSLSNKSNTAPLEGNIQNDVQNDMDYIEAV